MVRTTGEVKMQSLSGLDGICPWWGFATPYGYFIPILAEQMLQLHFDINAELRSEIAAQLAPLSTDILSTDILSAIALVHKHMGPLAVNRVTPAIRYNNVTGESYTICDPTRGDIGFWDTRLLEDVRDALLLIRCMKGSIRIPIESLEGYPFYDAARQQCSNIPVSCAFPSYGILVGTHFSPCMLDSLVKDIWNPPEFRHDSQKDGYMMPTGEFIPISTPQLLELYWAKKTVEIEEHNKKPPAAADANTQQRAASVAAEGEDFGKKKCQIYSPTEDETVEIKNVET